MKRLIISISVIFFLASFSPVPTFAGAEQRLTNSLLQAAGKGDIEQVQLLISQGADVNAKERSDMKPLHCAALVGQKDVAELLIDKGADVNAKIGFGQTPTNY